LYNRAFKIFKKINKIPSEIGRYYMTSHIKDIPNENRFQLLKDSNNEIIKSGIKKGLNTTVYKLVKIEITKLFTRLFVEYSVT
jgi:hypothetical protein